jgi:uncharacterized protein YggE
MNPNLALRPEALTSGPHNTGLRIQMHLLKTLLFSSFLFAGTFGIVQAQQAPPSSRIITVTGDAEVNVAPDEAVMTWAVETFNKDSLSAKKQNDTAVKKVLEVTARNSVKGNDIKTDFINIEPRYQESAEQRLLIGFVVRKTLRFEMPPRAVWVQSRRFRSV